MVAELTFREVGSACDRVVVAALRRAAVEGPEVDSLAVARALGLTVTVDDRQAGRGRLVRLNEGRRRAVGAIVVRREPRRERLQWSVAHEIGESLAVRVCEEMGLGPADIGENGREQIANLLAGRLLLPTEWLSDCAREVDWDLLEIKRQFSTASHELIARRMLEFDVPAVMTVWDQDRITWRRSNRLASVPPPCEAERVCRRRAGKSGLAERLETDDVIVQAWPIYEGEWRREIVRMEWKNTID